MRPGSEQFGAAGVVRSLVSVPMLAPFQDNARARSATIVHARLSVGTVTRPIESWSRDDRRRGAGVSAERAQLRRRHDETGAVTSRSTRDHAERAASYGVGGEARTVRRRAGHREKSEPGTHSRESMSTWVISRLPLHVEREIIENVASCITSRPRRSRRRNLQRLLIGAVRRDVVVVQGVDMTS